MKRIIFLIIASLLVLGLVLPGCAPPEEEIPEEVIYTFEDNEIVAGIAGEVGHATGDMQYLGAALAQAGINGAGGIVIDGVAHNITLQIIDTQEVSDETGAPGKAAMEAAIDDVDVIMGGFRTEALEVYREVAVGPDGAGVMFFNCGAATELLQHSCVDDYDNYKYWFKVTPYNEYFLARNVLNLVDFAASQIREALNMTPGAELRSCIIAEDLKWSRDEQVPVYEAGLPALNITNKHTYLVHSTDPTSTIGALADMAAKGYDPHIIIPVYSGTMGVAYAGTLLSYIGAGSLGSMTVGINVYAQLKAPWVDGLTNPDPGEGAYCAYNFILDTWGEEVAYTDMTLPFLNAFMAHAGEYPLYTAASYDALFMLKACLEDVGYVEGGVGKAKADDMIAWYEDPAKAQKTTTGEAATYYPQPGRTFFGEPALTEAQVRAIYDIDAYGYTYATADWVMPPNTTHDIAYGPHLLTGLGNQWQWDAGAGQWKKFGVWPAEGTGLVDQYGNWDFAYNGTKPFQLPPWVVPHFGP